MVLRPSEEPFLASIQAKEYSFPHFWCKKEMNSSRTRCGVQEPNKSKCKPLNHHQSGRCIISWAANSQLIVPISSKFRCRTLRKPLEYTQRVKTLFSHLRPRYCGFKRQRRGCLLLMMSPSTESLILELVLPTNETPYIPCLSFVDNGVAFSSYLALLVGPFLQPTIESRAVNSIRAPMVRCLLTHSLETMALICLVRTAAQKTQSQFVFVEKWIRTEKKCNCSFWRQKSAGISQPLSQPGSASNWVICNALRILFCKHNASYSKAQPIFWLWYSEGKGIADMSGYKPSSETRYDTHAFPLGPLFVETSFQFCSGNRPH